jgi:hypothetical protein
MRGRWAVLIIVLLGSVNLCWAIQSAVQTPMVSPDWTGSIEHLTLNGALICAVVVLWKQLGKKDDLLIASTQTVTETLAAAAASNVELRRIIDESVAAKKALTAVIDDLQVGIGKLPCALPVHHGKGQE